MKYYPFEYIWSTLMSYRLKVAPIIMKLLIEMSSMPAKSLIFFNPTVYIVCTVTEFVRISLCFRLWCWTMERYQEFPNTSEFDYFA